MEIKKAWTFPVVVTVFNEDLLIAYEKFSELLKDMSSILDEDTAVSHAVEQSKEICFGSSPMDVLRLNDNKGRPITPGEIKLLMKFTLPLEALNKLEIMEKELNAGKVIPCKRCGGTKKIMFNEFERGACPDCKEA